MVSDSQNAFLMEFKRKVSGSVHLGRNALMRKHATLCCKQILTGDPDCPEKIKLAKRIKFMIGNKAAAGDTEEKVQVNNVKIASKQDSTVGKTQATFQICSDQKKNCHFVSKLSCGWLP